MLSCRMQHGRPAGHRAPIVPEISMKATQTAPPLPTAFPWPDETAYQAALDLSSAMTRLVVEAQQLPLRSALAWQQAMVATQQELFDEWACRFAGGVPIDG
jgi:hypothetical protein